MKAKILNFKLKNQSIKVHSFKRVNSTNIIARDLAAEGCAEGTTVIASEQTAGKGRLGRTFLSQKGGIYLSLVLRPTLPPAELLFITVAAAVAAARAIEGVSGKKCDIKWVNDVYINSKKVCGILTEGAFNADGGLSYAVLGVGINLFEPKSGFPDNLPLADSVFHKEDTILLKKRAKQQVMRTFLDCFFEFYENISAKEYIKEYQSRSFLTGKEITYTKDQKNYNATVEGIDDNANLVVKTDDSIQTLSHGEIQIVGMEQFLA